MTGPGAVSGAQARERPRRERLQGSSAPQLRAGCDSAGAGASSALEKGLSHVTRAPGGQPPGRGPQRWRLLSAGCFLCPNPDCDPPTPAPHSTLAQTPVGFPRMQLSTQDTATGPSAPVRRVYFRLGERPSSGMFHRLSAAAFCSLGAFLTTQGPLWHMDGVLALPTEGRWACPRPLIWTVSCPSTPVTSGAVKVGRTLCRGVTHLQSQRRGGSRKALPLPATPTPLNLKGQPSS